MTFCCRKKPASTPQERLLTPEQKETSKEKHTTPPSTPQEVQTQEKPVNYLLAPKHWNGFVPEEPFRNIGDAFDFPPRDEEDEGDNAVHDSDKTDYETDAHSKSGKKRPKPASDDSESEGSDSSSDTSANIGQSLSELKTADLKSAKTLANLKKPAKKLLKKKKNQDSDDEALSQA